MLTRRRESASSSGSTAPPLFYQSTACTPNNQQTGSKRKGKNPQKQIASKKKQGWGHSFIQSTDRFITFCSCSGAKTMPYLKPYLLLIAFLSVLFDWEQRDSSITHPALVPSLYPPGDQYSTPWAHHENYRQTNLAPIFTA